MRQGERSVQALKVCSAHSTDFSLWQSVQGLGTLSDRVDAGVMKRNVWAWTFTSPSVSSINGMWQDTHWLPALSSLWCVWAGMLSANGPIGEFGA
jgi:hypothetical protein